MTDSMNFGPDWIRNLSSEGTTTGGPSGTRYQLAEYRYGREEMLALFDKSVRPPSSIINFKPLYSQDTLLPLALTPHSEEEGPNILQGRGWQTRPASLAPTRGRGGPLERGGRVSRGGRGGYPAYGRPGVTFESGWGNGEQPDWSPRKDFNARGGGTDSNWRRARQEEDDGWRSIGHGGATRPLHEKWGRSSSWRGEGDADEKTPPSAERALRNSWNDKERGQPTRRSWDNEDHLPEWAMDNPMEGGGTFDSSGAFHGSDDDQPDRPPKKEAILQKSTSHQHIQANKNFPLPTSKSAISLTKPDEFKEDKGNLSRDHYGASKENGAPSQERPTTKQKDSEMENIKPDMKKEIIANGPAQNLSAINKVEEDFERIMQEDVLKLVVDEDIPKSNIGQQPPLGLDTSNIQPPPNLGPPMQQEQWLYQDPQGQLQGPFSNIEMADWFKAGYFNNQLKVRRPCDEKFFMLGDLVTVCDGANPFQSAVRFPSLKADPATKIPERELLQYQYLMAIKQAQARSAAAEPWNPLAMQPPQDLVNQRLNMHPQIPHVPQDLPPLNHQINVATNPLMHMINQMQQANKLPSVNSPLDQPQTHPFMHNRLPIPGFPNHPPGGMQQDPLALAAGLAGHPLSALHGNLAGSLGLNMPRPNTTHVPVDQMSPKQDDPISSLLKQLQQQKQQQQTMDSLWQHNQFGMSAQMPPQQWQPPENLSMWDMVRNSESPLTSHQIPKAQQQPPKPADVPQEPPQKPITIPKANENKQHDENAVSNKELKRKKEQDEKQAKKDAEDKRKAEQRKLEMDKKTAEEKRKKEEERIKKELEKAKREAEDKRMKELDEKRKQKEQRKAEEEHRKKSEEEKKQEEDKIRREAKEREDFLRKEAARQAQEQAARAAKIAPWSQSSSNQGLSLAEIQRLEREKRAQEALLLQEKQQQQMLEQFNRPPEKPTGIQLSWANKPMEARKVKSLAEIQAEEQEYLAKQTAEARLLALQKEKENPPVQNVGSIWSSANLNWSNTNNAQWSSNNSSGGFWDEPAVQPQPPKQSKPFPVSKTSSSAALSQTAKQQNQQQNAKNKPKKKEESSSSKAKNGASAADDFTNWCYQTLSNMSANVDVPTFVTFLRDIESALDIREYCKEYLGENSQTQQFASNFLEKRRSFKPKSNAHKDDMCSPAPAITPSMQHSNEFQEVKNKKNKKGKMLKVDSKILGFNVTSAPDRINVGDRDYGDN